MERVLEQEWLDDLAATDPRAHGSRRDLRRLNWCMGNRSILAAALAPLRPDSGPVHLHELGAGDGDLLSKVAWSLGPTWRGTRATLVDRHNVISSSASDRFAAAGWPYHPCISDVFDWCREGMLKPPGIIVTNLFLHHLDLSAVSGLFEAIAQPGVHFVALEPSRSWFALAGSRFVGLIGCNSVTRHDAPASVRAGFRANELSSLWPRRNGWILRERSAGLFGHLFVARSDWRG
jgi:hypothetical protein